jgi:CubicO group peptidase (beta-lactamase class C family)
MYHVSGDLVGVLIARVSGKSLGEFLGERIFEPLGMKDTGFQVPEGKMDRVPGMYHMHREKQVLSLYEETANSAWKQQPAFEAGGGGLVSTMVDYFEFSRMMLNKGRHGRTQILSRVSVELMTSDQLSPENREGSELFFGDFSSWGLGMAVDIRSRELFQVPGRYGWTGGYGTIAYNDPANGMIGILFTQRMMESPEPPQVFSDFWNLAYGAME